MQEVFSEKCKVEIIVSSESVFNRDYEPSQLEYPASFLEIVGFWKHLVMKNGTCPPDSVFEGAGPGGALVLASCLWCRDHGIPLPSQIRLDDPVLCPADGIASRYFSGADVDDPCALPLIADYYGFPPLSVTFHESSPFKEQSEQLCRRLCGQGMPFEKKAVRYPGNRC